MKTTIWITLFVSIFIIWACGGEDEPGLATFDIEYNFSVGNAGLNFSDTYEINGTTVSFDAVNFYIGGLIITQEDGSVIDLSNEYLLAGVGNSGTLDNQFPVSDIVRVEFFVGVDPVTNSQSEEDFTLRPTTDVLGIQDPSMHWNWNTGYKFVRVDGDADTDGDGVVDTGIAYHIGSDELLQRHVINGDFKVEGGSNTITFEFDLEDFFEGVDLSTEIDTHTGNNLDLAIRLKDNMVNALTINL